MERDFGFTFASNPEKMPKVESLNGTMLPDGILHAELPASGEAERRVSAQAVRFVKAAYKFAQDVQECSKK
jgi:hypothetical protein